MKKLILVFLVLAAILLAGCSDTSGKLESIKEKNQLVVYTNPQFPPFEFMEGTDIVGVDIEIAKEIAKELDVELKMESAVFDTIITMLASNKGDISLSGITITEDRKKEVDFSKPYIKSVQYLLLPEGSDLTTMESLAGKTVGVAQNYTGQFVLEDEMDKGVLKDKNTEMKVVKTATTGVQEIKNGKIDALIMDEYVAKVLAEQNTGINAIELKFDNGDNVTEEYGVAVPKGNEDLLKIINEVIDRLVADNKIEGWVTTFATEQK